jgi:hypothetical protein
VWCQTDVSSEDRERERVCVCEEGLLPQCQGALTFRTHSRLSTPFHSQYAHAEQGMRRTTIKCGFRVTRRVIFLSCSSSRTRLGDSPSRRRSEGIVTDERRARRRGGAAMDFSIGAYRFVVYC